MPSKQQLECINVLNDTIDKVPTFLRRKLYIQDKINRYTVLSRYYDTHVISKIYQDYNGGNRRVPKQCLGQGYLPGTIITIIK
jgi:hypothetical protein